MKIDELTKCEFEAVRELIKTNDQRYEEKFKNNRETRDAAFSAVDRRIDGINELRGAMSDQAARMQPRDEANAQRDTVYEKMEQQRLMFEGRINTEQAKLEQQRITFEALLKTTVDPLRAQIDEQNKPKWGLYLATVSVLILMVSGVWQINAMKIDTVVSPVQLASEQSKIILNSLSDRLQKVDVTSQASAMADSGSRADRLQLNERLRQVEAIAAARTQTVADVEALKVQAQSNGDRYAIIRADVTRQGAALVEVETQFCASDIVRNLMHANDMRIAAATWRKVFPDSVLPTDNAYYPQVCNRLGASQTQATR